MIIKNNNKAVDVLKNQHVCWEVRKSSIRGYAKTVISYGSWSAHKEPETIPSISWEGGTTVNIKCWVERIKSTRIGFDTYTVTEKKYLIPSFSEIASDCIVNTTGNNEDGFTFTFGIRDNATSDRTYTGVVQYTDESGSYPITVTITQTKRGKYVTKLDNASITTDLIPAGGGNISSGTLTFSKTYNTSETENASENVTFSTVSATTKGTTESPVTDVTTIPAGGTTQKQTTIDGVTLTHPSFTVKQAANTKTIKTPESKTTTSVILSVNPTVVYSSGGTVTFTLLRKYTLNKVVYLYTSGSTSSGGSDANQGPETVNANLTYTITGITNVSSTTGTSYEVPESDTERTIKFKTTYDGITSNEASVSLKLDVPNESKAFIYSNLKITEYSYTKDKSGYHFPASGKTITATDCTLKGTYDWTYTSMENKTVTETVTWTFNDLTAAMYTFTPTFAEADSLGTTTQSANNLYKSIKVDIKDLKHTYNGKLYDVKDEKGTSLTDSSTAVLTRLGNSGEQASDPISTELSVSVSPTSFDYKGGSATLTATLIKIFNITWTSGATSTNPTNTDVTSSTKFTGVYYISGESSSHEFPFTDNKPVIPNILSSTKNRTYTFTGKYSSYSDTATLTQTGNTTLYTVTWANTDASIAIWKDNTTQNKTSSVTHGTQYKLLTAPAEFANPIKNSGDTIRYTAAWYTLPANGVLLSSSTTLVTKDITVYAVLTISGYKVTLNPASGTLTVSGKAYTTISPYITYTKGSFNLGSFVPTHTNLNFKGWSTNSSATTGSTSSVTINAAITYYAIWKQLFTVTWNLNGGNIGGDTSNKTESVESGSTVSFTKYTPVKTNSSFLGWSDLSTAQTGSLSGNSPAIFANITYYAIWASYGTINLNPNGGTLTVSGTAYTSTYTFRYYQTSLTLSAFTPTRNGYTFVGWNENKDATTGETSFTLGTTIPTTIWTGTKTYYAIWKSAILTPILLILA